jgi:phosphoglycerate dehydrogenase-like enzyme
MMMVLRQPIMVTQPIAEHTMLMLTSTRKIADALGSLLRAERCLKNLDAGYSFHSRSAGVLGP